MAIKLCFYMLIFVCGTYNVMGRKHNRDYTEFIDQMFKMTSNEQVLEDVPFIPYKQWREDKGMYKTEVKFYVHGSTPAAKLLRLVNILDNNMFATAWVTTILLEAVQYGSAPKPTDHQLQLAINALLDYHDKSKPYNTSVMLFWPEVKDEKTKYWSSFPENLVGVFEMLVSIAKTKMNSIFKMNGYGNIIGDAKSIVETEDTIRRIFNCPPDFDSTFVNLGIGSILYQLRDIFPGASSLWNSQNSNLTSVFDALKKYAYRPFSDDQNTNIIDPRTYFYMRAFLDKAKSEGSDLALVPTWTQTIEELRSKTDGGVTMGLLINNVEFTVTADTIFGITSGVVSGLLDAQVLNDPDIQNIYLNASSFIAFEIKSNFSGRYELASTYYPSQVLSYWAFARTLAVLETENLKGSFPVPAMETVYVLLKDAAEHEMTDFILSTAKHEGAEGVYFDDFLGQGDATQDNQPLARSEDRVFTTSMAANALIYTWTVYDDNTKTTHWKQGVPDSVKETVSGCVLWLLANALDGGYYPWNAVFSLPEKDVNDINFYYPANFFEDLNGKTFSDWFNFPDTMFTYGVKGYIPKEEYDVILKERKNRFHVPLTFQGFNSPTVNFAFWSSDAVTYASCLLAVSRFRNIVA